jgi:hypothetical protein
MFATVLTLFSIVCRDFGPKYFLVISLKKMIPKDYWGYTKWIF